jgi:hypothetical protein
MNGKRTGDSLPVQTADSMDEGGWKADTKSWSDLVAGSDGGTPSSRHANYHVSGRKGTLLGPRDFPRMRRTSSSSDQTIGSGYYEPLRKEVLDLRDRVHPHMHKPSFIMALRVKTTRTDSNEAPLDVDFEELPSQWDSFKANDQDFSRAMFSGGNNDKYETRVPARTPSPLGSAGRCTPWRIGSVFRRIMASYSHFWRVPWVCSVANGDVVPM